MCVSLATRCGFADDMYIILQGRGSASARTHERMTQIIEITA